MIHLTVPIEPVTKKNSQQIILVKGRPMIFPSKKYKAYEKEALQYLLFNGIKTIETPVCVTCYFYMKTRRRVDLTNLLEAIDDILVKAEILKDDDYTILESHDGSRVYYDKENPRTEIFIEEVKHE